MTNILANKGQVNTYCGEKKKYRASTVFRNQLALYEAPRTIQKVEC
jgi:hypothetical protein